jgi:hypothetical protein
MQELEIDAPYRIDATMYPLGTWFVSGIRVWIPCTKETMTMMMLQTARCLKREVQRETRKIKDNIAEKTKEIWQWKIMHGQLPHNLDERLVDIEESYRWLKSGDIKGETESTIDRKSTRLNSSHVD